MDTGDTEQKPRPLKAVMKDTNKSLELEAEDTNKCISIQHD